MGWALAVCFIIGVISAARLPVLIFTLIVFFVLAGYAIASISTGTTFIAAVGWGTAIATVLEAGYVCAHAALYFIVVRRADGRRTSRKIQTKYTVD